MDEQNKTKSSYRGIIIFLVIFAVISLGITYSLVKNNSKIANEKKPVSNDENGEILIETGNYGIKDLKGYYYTNKLKITEKKHTEGDMITEYGYTYYPIEVNYIEIDGLKDKNIEDKINKEIKDTAFRLIPEVEETVRINSYVQGNFSNVLSISIYGGYSDVHLNYDLTTGNQIKFEECFTENANIKSILQNCLYDELTINDYDYYVYEEIAFEAMYKFSKNDYSFYILNDSIVANFNIDSNLYITIPLEKYYHEIAIFNRFVNDESIFTDEYSLSKKVHYGLDENAEYYYIKDNLLIYLNDYEGTYLETLENYLLNKGKLSIKDNTDGLSEEEKTKNEVLKALKNKIENLIEYSKNTPDTMHILGISISKSGSVENFKLECTKSDFYKSIEKELYQYLINQKMLRSYYSYYESEIKEFNDKFSMVSFADSYLNDNGNIDYTNEYYYSGDYYHLGDIKSDIKLIMNKDIEYFSEEGLNIAYNEIFARHGHDFVNKNLKEAFSASLWYLPTYGKTVSLEELNDIEKQNASKIKDRIEKTKKYPNGFFEIDETYNTVDLGYDWEKYQFSYSDDANKIGEIYTPFQSTLIYNEERADKVLSKTKSYFKGKYLHIILKETKEVYQTIEIDDNMIKNKENKPQKEQIINVTDKEITGVEYVILEEYSYLVKKGSNKFLEIRLGCVDEIQYQDDYITITPAPTKIENDVYGNKYAYYDLSNMNEGETLDVIIKRKVKCSEYKNEIPTSTNTEILEGFDKYIKPQKRIDSEYEKIVLKAQELTKDLKSDYEKAKAIFEFVNVNMQTEKSGNEGSIYAIENMSGTSEESATLFVAMCRAVNIPSRAVEGYQIKEDKTLVDLAWSEIYLKDFGWVPVHTYYEYTVGSVRMPYFEAFCKMKNTNHIIRSIYFYEQAERTMKGINESFSSISLIDE